MSAVDAARAAQRWGVVVDVLTAELESGGTVTEGMRQVIRVAKTRRAEALRDWRDKTRVAHLLDFADEETQVDAPAYSDNPSRRALL